MKTRPWIALAVGVVALGGLVALAQGPGEWPPAKAGGRGDGAAMVAAIRATPGCLGVETARTASGKNVIFAWFKDKKAVVAWYESGMHQKLMTRFPDREDREPLSMVPDNTGPILVIASVTPGEKPQVEGTTMPISQIAIELYQPLPGGAYAGGRFAPSSVVVPNMRGSDAVK
jgi:hypothetical protein